jgi:antitoxin VapB
MLNIKNPETYQLAKKLAILTGDNMTIAITDAVREKIARLEKPSAPQTNLESLLSIGKKCAEHMQMPIHSTEHDRLLYNEHGLPQ